MRVFTIAGTLSQRRNVQGLIARAGTSNRTALAARVVATLVLGLVALAPSARADGLADNVRVFAGTRPGHDTFGGGHNFPGASAALRDGSVEPRHDARRSQRPRRLRLPRLATCSGFSLTHLSGAGCALYGDFPFMPTTEPLRRLAGGATARHSTAASSRASPIATRVRHPGYYAVRLNPVGGGAIDTELTATTRTGMARFAFPRSPARQRPDQRRRQRPAGRLRRGRGSIPLTARSTASPRVGYFCGQRPRYRVYFAAVFVAPLRRLRHLAGKAAPTGCDRQPAKASSPLRIPRTTAAGGRLRQLRHAPQPHRERPRRHLVHQRRCGSRQPRR